MTLVRSSVFRGNYFFVKTIPKSGSYRGQVGGCLILLKQDAILPDLATLSTPGPHCQLSNSAASADYRALMPLVDDVSTHLGRKPRDVSGDAGFATEANLTAMKERRIEPGAVT